jgi:hypothetical protein
MTDDTRDASRLPTDIFGVTPSVDVALLIRGAINHTAPMGKQKHDSLQSVAHLSHTHMIV